MTGAPPGAGGPLAGVAVLDLSRLLPGGYCTLLLADLGADVVKVEEPGRGDYIRWSPPLVDGVSAAHRALNRGKRSITLNLKAPEGAGVLRRLAAHADIVVESFRPGVMDRLGVGYEALTASNPRLVYAAISGYGQDGPYRTTAGHDINYLGYAGVLWQGGPTGSEPSLAGVQIGDLGGGGMLAAVGILAALADARVTGRGRFVDASMTDGAVSWLSIHAGSNFAMRAADGPDLPRTLSGDLACYRVYRTSDGRHVTVGALEPQFWRTLCQTLGCDELIDEQFGPPETQARLMTRLEKVFDTRTRDEWLTVFDRVEACVGPVNDLDEAFADPQIRHREMVALVNGEQVGPGPAVKLRTPNGEPEALGAMTPAPGLGEHTDQVLAAIGIGGDELADLRARGVI
jgi:crotonobetainyl-CoA:carnitine CoA-transferase CaiB-like acyl-CoA transferase